MSDLFGVREKTVEGANWRGTVTITMDGENYDLSVRQLRDKEFFRVMKQIDRDELAALREELPEDLMEEYNELQEKEDLDDVDAERLEELEEELNEQSTSLFDELSTDTFEGIVQCGYHGVEPDNEDLKEALFNHAEDIEEKYGVTPKSDQDEVVHRYVKEEVLHDMLEKSTNFQSFIIGMEVLIETVGGEGN